MTIVYLIPILGLFSFNGITVLISLLTYLLMSASYWPIVRFYQCSAAYALALPAIALLYNLMTLDSARKHWQGQGGNWKGRVYEAPQSTN
jgi:hypothetical protein